MSALGGFLQALAGTITLWRDAAIVLLALIVIGCLWLYASVAGD